MLIHYKDILFVDFTHSHEQYEVEVTEMREMFGSEDGEKKMPLCKGIIVKVIKGSKYGDRKIDKEMSFNLSWVTHIVSRSCLGLMFPKVNIFASRYLSLRQQLSIKTKRNTVLCAPLKELCGVYLSRLNEEITVEIDYQKLKKRSKSLTGIISSWDVDRERYIFTVKKSHFEKWFKKNWRHILRSKVLENKLKTEEIKRLNAAYEETVYNDLEKDELFSDDFKKQYGEPYLDEEGLNLPL